MERLQPRPRDWTPWSPPESSQALHAWTDGSFRLSASLGWVITRTNGGSGEVIAQGNKSLGPQQTAFDAEVAAIETALHWFMTGRHGRHALIVHSGSTCAIARAGHTGAGPGQERAVRIQRWVTALKNRATPRTIGIAWIKGHSGVPGSERADRLAG